MKMKFILPLMLLIVLSIGCVSNTLQPETQNQAADQNPNAVESENAIKTEKIIIDAYDYGFVIDGVEVNNVKVPQGSTIELAFRVGHEDVYYGGLDFRSEKFRAINVSQDSMVMLRFKADKTFKISSYWPLTNDWKADLTIETA